MSSGGRPLRGSRSSSGPATARPGGTERAGSGCFVATKTAGVYVCAGCDNPLFGSGEKYESGTGWLSFTAPISADALIEIRDVSHGMERVEVRCARCDGHQGHVFPRGGAGLRYCINSAAMKHVPDAAASTVASR